MVTFLFGVRMNEQTTHSLYTYAFLDGTPDRLPEGFRQTLQGIEADGITAVVETDLAIAPLKENEELLVRAVVNHDRVIRELFEQGTLLPLRFGTCFRSSEDLQDHLQTNAARYRDRLNQLRGKAEGVLRLVPLPYTATTPLPEAGGKAYFLAKKRQYQEQVEYQHRQKQERELLRQSIARQYPDIFLGEPREDGVERLYVLVGRDAGEELQNHLSEWSTECPSWELSLEVPLPPYHFV